MAITKENIIDAAERIQPYIHRTPILSSQMINEICDASIYFKCENFQKAGAFKSRGATNAVFSLDEKSLQNGVATHSSGNHAGALALAAKRKNIPAYIVMPENAPKVKIAAVKEYGGKITFCKPTLEARETTLNKVIAETQATEIHPYNDKHIIAGQATACKELIEDSKFEYDIIMAPVGGGGLLSGTLLSAKYFSPKTIVIAGEPKGADDAFQSFTSKTFVASENPNTIADGLLTSLGEITYPIIMEHIHDILTVEESSIKKAMQLMWERMKIIIEPSSAVCLAAIMENPEVFKNKTVGIIISGGNVDLNKLPWQ